MLLIPVWTDLLDEDLDNLDISGGEEEPDTKDNTLDLDDAPIVRYVNKILLDAIKKGVSDIHLEPFEKNFRIRYRRRWHSLRGCQPSC